ncbi:MAG TPA: exopolysaccharide biosynthesis polyprenyl glycosylphosphotransferase [Rhizomicrobium sp.]|nr:exopolysaccharide biosynthesis polyprenyl glycosylphosphotransferase [Rhizomicrobium sp.]
MTIYEDIARFGAHAPAVHTTHYVHSVAKRALDLIVAVPALIVLSPLLILLAILIRATSEGPALFRQTRLGLNGAPFRIFKFRTMTVLENGPVIRQAEQNDARITRVGGWMRRLSLDELPQLLNVIEGSMSLIGPRPHALAHDRFYGREIDGYDLRQSVKPGISGWAQVHGHRGATVTVSRMRERLAYDVWYARNASFALDVKIVLRTIGEVLRQRNAY